MELIAPRFHRLPLRGMAVFEAAARHGRFTGAAGELFMSQARVSQQISELEDELGVELFLRRSRGVQLTSAGAALLGDVEQGLKTLSAGMDRARRHAGRKVLQVLTDFGFAAWWLMPRLSQLERLLPGVEVRIATTQADVATTGSEFDLAIMFGRGDWGEYESTLLFAEEVFPVCSPGYASARSLPLAPEEIADLRLLHLRGAAKGRWFTWEDWHAAHDLPGDSNPDGLAFDNFQLVLQAALLGRGVCIGWTPLINELVDGGGLIKLTDAPMRSSRGYHIVEHPQRGTAPAVQVLKDWLLAARFASTAELLNNHEGRALAPIAI